MLYQHYPRTLGQYKGCTCKIYTKAFLFLCSAESDPNNFNAFLMTA